MSLSRSFSQILPHIVAILVAGAGCVGVAIWAKSLVESIAVRELNLTLGQSGHDWVEVTADGLSVSLTGTADTEAVRFAALSVANTVVDASRVIDDMTVKAAAAIEAPDFSIEVLKNDDGISLIGLVPTESDPETIVQRVRALAGDARITDLLESADFAPPAGWERALAFGLNALESLPRSKVSITSDRVAITAVAKDAADKRRIERRLDRDAPAGLALALEISAPRPVIAPFTIRFLIDDSGARFDACSADSEAARDAILTAAITAGLTGEISCDLGLGTPSTRWGEAAVAGIEALAEVGGGTLTMSNADISVVGKEGTSQRTFDRAMGELEGALPPVFSLTAVLPKVEVDEGNDSARPPEFVATRSPEGRVQLRGLLGDETTRAAVESYAAAAFGVNNVLPATRIDENVPQGWTARVLAALEGLSYMANGSATVTADEISISGQTGIRSARSDIARLLSSKLKDGAAFDLDVTYSEALDPLAALPTPEECVELINVAGNKRKITFAPSSSDIEADAMATIDAIADILRDCQTVQIEISGHTDSQGREVMNQQLSQARADAVLNAIMARRVLTSNLTARGYGEDQPIADNDTESGREANRRIEFQLVTPEDSEEDAEQSAEAAGDDDAEDNE
ncbi:MAG: OmpA family protein [Silicimonas sp.]|nr:OmpA family protein [Silicimonas sp.]